MRVRTGAAVLAALLLTLFVSGCQGVPASSSSLSVSTAPESASVASEPPALPDLPLANGTSPLTGLPLPEGAAPNQRPVSIMVANSQRALPQRGVAQAELVYEMLTEGGITRLMAVYPSAAIPQVGPVRSTRDQFVQFAVPMDSVHVHIGSSVYARNLLNTLAYQDVDGLYLGTTAFVFDVQRTLPKESGKLNENCWFTDAGLLAQGLSATGLSAEGQVRNQFHFGDEPLAEGDEAIWINTVFSPSALVGFGYAADTGLYTKHAFGQVHADEDGTPLTFTNVLLLFCGITLKPDGQCTEFDLREGDGLYINGGRVVPITWQKGAPEDDLRLFRKNGEELPVQRGKTYVGLLPTELRDQTTYQGMEQPADPASTTADPAASVAAPLPEDPISII